MMSYFVAARLQSPWPSPWITFYPTFHADRRIGSKYMPDVKRSYQTVSAELIRGLLVGTSR